MRQYTWSCNPWREQTLHVAMQAVSSYLTFSPLPQMGGYFLLHLPTLADSFYFQKHGVLYCPDFPLFLPIGQNQRQTVTLIFY